MRILVCPPSMEVGRAQLNAVELAGAVRDRGHEVVVLGGDGPLIDVVRRLGLERVPLDPRVAHRPSPYAVRQLSVLARERRLDVLHGYEWAPGLEAFAARPAAAVCTLLALPVPDFLPGTLPLVVGSEEIRAAALAAGHRSVTLLEPPVGVRAEPLPSPRAGWADPGPLPSPRAELGALGGRLLSDRLSLPAAAALQERAYAAAVARPRRGRAGLAADRARTLARFTRHEATRTWRRWGTAADDDAVAGRRTGGPT